MFLKEQTLVLTHFKKYLFIYCFKSYEERYTHIFKNNCIYIYVNIKAKLKD